MKKKIIVVLIIIIFLLTNISLTSSGKKVVTIEKCRSLTINEPPVSDPGGPYTAKGDEIVSLNGSSSYDPDGYIVEWQWLFQVRPYKPEGIGYGEEIDFDPDGYDNINLSWPINEINIILKVTDNDGASTYANTDLIYVKNKEKSKHCFYIFTSLFQRFFNF